MARQNPREIDRAIARIARADRREHVVARDELIAGGIDCDAIDRRVRAGMLRRLHAGVYLAGGELTPRGEIRAALLAEPQGAASGPTAAFVHRLLDDYQSPPHITTTSRAGHAKPNLHTTRGPLETCIADGLRVTTVERALLDLAAAHHPKLQRALNEAFYRRLTDRERLKPFAAGRRGSPVLREALERGARTRSRFEDELFAAVHAAQLPLPIANARVGLYEVDFLWPDHGVVVEVDGWAAHGHERARRNDAAKDAYLRTLGFQVIRVSRARFKAQPYAVIAELAGALSAARARR